MRIFSVLILFLLFLNNSAFSQFDKVRNYNMSDGLASSDNYKVIQDKQGYIWTIGDMGVSRFDGYTFKNFTTQDGLADNTNFVIHQDKKDRIWFGAFNGKLSYYLNDKIYTIPCNDSLKNKISFRHMTSMYVDSGDTIWIGVDGLYVIKINPTWQCKDLQEMPMSDGRYFITLENNEVIYGGAGKNSSAFFGYNQQLKKVIKIQPQFETTPNRTDRYIFKRLKDGSYLASVYNNLIHFNNKGVIEQTQIPTIILNILEINDKTVFVGTTNGIYSFKKYDFNKAIYNTSFANRIISGIDVDAENGIWVASEGQGLYYAPNRNYAYYTIQNGISSGKILSMGCYQNNVIVGHADGGAEILYTDSILSLYPLLHQYKNKLFDFYTHQNQTILVYAMNTGYLTKDGLVEIPQFKNKGLKKIITAHDRNIWALSYSRICKYNPLVNFSITDSILLKTFTDNIFEDSKGTLWICSIDGLYNYRNHQLHYLGDSNKLFAHRPSYIAEKKDGSLWITTRGNGVLIKKGNEVTQLTEKEGLVGNMCRALYVDGNAVWVGTNKGLSKITEQQNGKYNIENYYEKNGLLTNEVNVILKHDGKIWLAHNNGVTVLDDSHIALNTTPPPIYILQTLVNDSIYKTIQDTKLEHDQNFLTFKYIGLTYKDAGKINYKYKIEGLNKNWVYSKQTSVSYLSIPPGTYTFVVYAQNNDGYWSVKPATVSFAILKPWWKTWTFIILTLIFIIVATYLLFRYRLNAVKISEQFKSTQQIKLVNAELKALRAQMNPHFIFNTINSVQYFITNNDAISSQKYLSKFAKLIRHVLDNSKLTSISLHQELEALTTYLELEVLRFEKKFEYHITVAKDIDVHDVKIPSMLIQPYIENAIWHGLMHKSTKGEINLNLSLANNALLCVIEDNGIGRKQSQLINLEKNKTEHKSVGLAITQDRLDMINQQYNSKLTVTIIDLEDTDGNALGTRVELHLPFY